MTTLAAIGFAAFSITTLVLLVSVLMYMKRISKKKNT